MLNKDMGYISSTIHAGDLYNCILNQGDLIVKVTGNSKSISATHEIERGDFVELDFHMDSEYNYNTTYTPIMKYSSSKCNRVGQLISDPKWINIPSESKNDWSEMLRNTYYQFGIIQFFKSVFLADNNRYIEIEQYYKDFKGATNE